MEPLIKDTLNKVMEPLLKDTLNKIMEPLLKNKVMEPLIKDTLYKGHPSSRNNLRIMDKLCCPNSGISRIKDTLGASTFVHYREVVLFS